MNSEVVFYLPRTNELRIFDIIEAGLWIQSGIMDTLDPYFVFLGEL